MRGLSSFGLFLGRLCLCAIFIIAGIEKLVNYESTAKYMESVGMTMIPFFLYSAAAVEIIFGILLLIGFQTRVTAAVLLLYLIPTTLIFHAFWNVEGADQAKQMSNFLMNLAIFGGLLYVLTVGAGRFSLDGYKAIPSPTKNT